MKVITYTRVSSEDQRLEGVSLEAQAARLKAYCEAMGYEVVECIEDGGISGKTLQRPGLQRALAMLGSGEAEGLIVTKLDRLSRSTRDTLDLLDAYFGSGKLSLISLAEHLNTGSAQGRMIITFLAAMNQAERELIGERTSAALQHKISKGEHVGSPAFGAVMVEKRLVEVEAELAVIDRIISEREEGSTWRDIAAGLNRDDVPTKRGGTWQPTTARNLYNRHKVAV